MSKYVKNLDYECAKRALARRGFEREAATPEIVLAVLECAKELRKEKAK